MCWRLPSIGLRGARVAVPRRWLSSSTVRRDALPVTELPDRIYPIYSGPPPSSTLSWPSTPRNVLLAKKRHAPHVRDALISLAKHLKRNYPVTNIILEPSSAHSLHHEFDFPVYTLPPSNSSTPFPYTQSTYPRTPTLVPLSPVTTSTSSIPRDSLYHAKTDLAITLGGDGTILLVASLFSATKHVPPVLSFAMGTLGFLGEWRWSEHALAVRQVFSGEARVLRRQRLRVGVYDSAGKRVSGEWDYEPIGDAHAMNEVIIHRGMSPHMAIMNVFVDNCFLTEAVADGMIMATPTGSTAYSLSSGGSIIHPSVSSLLLTPICPRSLSFRPLVLPPNCLLTLALSPKNRADSVDVSVDGRRWGGIARGEEVRVWAEEGEGSGIPCVRGGSRDAQGGGDGWVGGLNGLLKFNYPFGEE